MKLNRTLLCHSAIAASLVVAGVVVKNSSEQWSPLGRSPFATLGPILFTLGWFYVAYAMSIGRRNPLMVVVPSLLILASVMIMKSYMAKKQSPPMLFPAIFAISWIVLGYCVANMWGLIAAALVIASMMLVLPHQRKNGIIDGPGMPMFVAAWAILVIANSNRA